MSFVITLFVREGIVMASDSRLTLNNTVQQGAGGPRIVQLAVGQSDSSYKIFLAPNNIGISTFGGADIQGVPMAGYIESFISEKLSNAKHEVNDVAKQLLEYFTKLSSPPDTQFYVAGYVTEAGKRQQHVWHVSVSRKSVERKNPPDQQGAQWGGEADILNRLTQAVGMLDAQGNLTERIPSLGIPFQFFTLQDAIDFAVYAVKVTADSIRFQPRAKTVGGPIDVLVIKPDDAFWVQRKELHV